MWTVRSYLEYCMGVEVGWKYCVYLFSVSFYSYFSVLTDQPSQQSVHKVACSTARACKWRISLVLSFLHPSIHRDVGSCLVISIHYTSRREKLDVDMQK